MCLCVELVGPVESASEYRYRWKFFIEICSPINTILFFAAFGHRIYEPKFIPEDSASTTRRFLVHATV